LCGNKESVFLETYPLVNEKALVKDETEYAVQINSKIKTKMMIAQGLSDEEIVNAVCAHPDVAAQIEGKTIRKSIVVKNRLVNLIVG
ncbi:MAG: leucine--tRNA ligase, partial [Clostridia bacterium]|nr:leucine--tRNA ligase [Clostridia bacterium]